MIRHSWCVGRYNRHTKEQGYSEDTSIATDALPLTDQLVRALSLLSGVETKVAPGEFEDEADVAALEDAPTLKEVYELLDEINGLLPQVECWCVVKHYRNDTSLRPWHPRVWLGCLTKEQADAFAPAIQKAFDREGRSGASDEFKVEYRACRVSDIVRPELKAAEYAKGLNR